MKNGKKKAAESKMSLAARKAWETRRKKNGNVKKEKREKSRKGRRIDSQLQDILDGNVSVEQLKKGYRKGMLMNKPKRSQVRKSSVKMDEKWMAYLYGSDWLEKVVIAKLVAYSKKLMGAMIFDMKAGKKLVVKGRELEVPKVMVVQ